MSWPASPNILPAISMLCCHGIGSRPRHHAARRLNLTASNLKLPCGLYRMLSEHRMGRNYLKGRDGDRINAVLAAAGYNFGLLLRWLARLLRALFQALFTAVADAQPA